MQRLSDTEKEILQIIWDNGGSILFAPLAEKAGAMGRSWKKSTLLTFLTRLCEKEYLTAVKTGRTKEYTATLTEDQYLELQATEFLDTVYGGNVGRLVSTLLRGRGMDEQDLLELEEFWKKEGEGE